MSDIALLYMADKLPFIQGCMILLNINLFIILLILAKRIVYSLRIIYGDPKEQIDQPLLFRDKESESVYDMALSYSVKSDNFHDIMKDCHHYLRDMQDSLSSIDKKLDQISNNLKENKDKRELCCKFYKTLEEIKTIMRGDEEKFIVDTMKNFKEVYDNDYYDLYVKLSVIRKHYSIMYIYCFIVTLGSTIFVTMINVLMPTKEFVSKILNL